jgi:chromosome segregation ATPase
MATIQLSKLRQSVQTWKNKAIRRGKQLKQLHKRVRELGQSREQWKSKAQAGQARIAALQAENRRLRRELDTAKKTPSPGPVDTPTVS